MDENTAIDAVSKTSLPRKALIVVSATAGLILAGYALAKVRSPKDDTFETLES